jgi:hypothetical protein
MQLHPCHFDRACEWRNPLLEASRDSHSDESARTRRPTVYVTVIGLGSRSRITEPVTDQTVAQQHGPQRQGHRRRSATAAAPRHENRPPLRVGDFSTCRLGRNDTEGARPHGGVMIVLRNGIVRDRPRSRTPETVTESVAVSGPALSLPQSLPLPQTLPQSLVLRMANGGAGILPAVLPSPRRRGVHARAGSPRHQGWWCSKTVSSVSDDRGRVGFRRCTRSLTLPLSLTLSLPLMQLHPCHFDRACEWRNPLLEASRDSHSDESARTRRPTMYVTVIGLGSRSRITEPATDQTVAQQHDPQRQGHRRRSATAAAPRHENRPPLRVGDFSTRRLGRNDTEGVRPHGGVMIVLRNGIVRDRQRGR